MVKSRKIAIVALSVVNIVLLLHAILPHHHHDDDLCFTESHCADAVADVDLECFGDEGHEHDMPGADETCDLNPTFLLPGAKGTSGKSEVKKILRNLIGNVLNSPDKETNVLVSLRTFKQSPAPDLYRRVAGRSLSLRAPPAIS